MNPTIEKYLRDVSVNVWAPRDEQLRLETDLRARFDQGLERGESVSQIADELGSPDEVAAAFMVGRKLEYAGFFERAFAFIADVAVCFTLPAPAFLVAALVLPGLESPSSELAAVAAMALLVTLSLGFFGFCVLYFPILESRFGKTAGKHLMRIRVRNEDGGEITLGAALVRRLSLYFKVFVLDSLFVPFTAKKQRALDIVAKTVVLREPGETRGFGRYLLCLAVWLPLALIVALCAILVGMQA